MEKFNPKKFKFHRSLVEILNPYLPYEERPKMENNVNSYSPGYMNFMNKFWEVCQISMQIGN